MTAFRHSFQLLAAALVMATLPVVSSAQEELLAPPKPVSAERRPQMRMRKAEIPSVLFLPAPGEAERRILAALDEKNNFEFLDTPLVDVVQFTARKSGIPVILDLASLDDAGIPGDEPVSVTIVGVTLRSALKIILSDLGLTTVIEDEVLKITTKEAAEAKEITRVYPVGDLVSSSDESSWSELSVAVQTGVLKGRWQTVDGTGGTVSMVRSAKALVIRQSRNAHDQIVELLTSLRAARQLAPPVAENGEDEARHNAPGLISLPVASIGGESPLSLDEPTVITLEAGAAGKPAQVKFEGKIEPISKAVERISKLKRLKTSSVLIRADAEAEHKDLVYLIDALQKVGVEKLSISVREEPAEGK